nr:lipopolysaccharide transport periplasmic protein LptA [Desulfobulbaceae bacterium]
MKKVFFFVFLTSLLLSASLALAAGAQKPIQIESDHMLSMQKENTVFFSGKVVAKQEDLVIHADEMTVYYNEKKDDAQTPKQEGTKSKDVERIFAEGNVEITQLEWVATGDAAEYFSSERKVILTGKAKVWQDNNLVTGNKVVMYLDEGKSVVERSSDKGERVKAFFYPDSDKKQ